MSTTIRGPVSVQIGEPEERPGVVVEPLYDPVPREAPREAPEPRKNPEKVPELVPA